MDNVEDYLWSSYSQFLSSKKIPLWLYREEIYAQLGVESRIRSKYKAFVEMGDDGEINDFYSKGNVTPFMRSPEFRQWAYKQRDTEESSSTNACLRALRPSIEEIIDQLAELFNIPVEL